MKGLKRRVFLHRGLFTASFWFSLILFRKGQTGEPSATPPPEEEPPLSEAARELVSNNTAFGLDLYQLLAAQPGNLFFSAYSLSAALAMAYAGARGVTATEMTDVLKLSLDSDQVHPAFAELQSALEANVTETYQFTVANRLWGQAGYPFLESFVQLVDEHYGSGFATVDFKAELEAARQTINTWAEEQTSGKIENLLAPGILTDLTRFVLTNATYFKAQWLELFQPERTEEASFTISPGQTITVPMMKGESSFAPYVALDDVQLLELLYEGHEQSMIIVLPNQIDGLASIEQQLTPALLEQWLMALDQNSSFGALDIWLPKFKVSSEFRLDETLASLGMPTAFNERANFSGVDGELDLYLQAVVHKAFIDVDEFGTEAAAATAVVGGLRSSRGAIYVDHPFLLLIRDIQSQSILFLGRVINPLS